MKLPTFLLLSFAYCGTAQHWELPKETNVFSPSYCKTNPDGFGGITLSNEEPAENKFYYEMKTRGNDLPDDAVDSMIFIVEQRIADYLLSETDFFSACATGGKDKGNRQLRRLQTPAAEALAITINPRDLPVEGGTIQRVFCSVLWILRSHPNFDYCLLQSPVLSFPVATKRRA